MSTTPTSGEIKFSDLNTTFGNANSELKFSEYEADSAAARIPDFKIGSTRSSASATPSTPQSTNPISSIIGSDNYAIPTPYDNDASFFGAAQFGSDNNDEASASAEITSNTTFGENQALLCNFVMTGNDSSGMSTTSAPAISSNRNASNAIIGRQTTRYVYAYRGSSTHSDITDLTVEFLEDITGEGNSGVFKLTGSLTGATPRTYEILIVARDGGENPGFLRLTGQIYQQNVNFNQPQLSMSQYHGLSSSGFTDTWPSGITTSSWNTILTDSLFTSATPGFFGAAQSIVTLSASIDTSNQRIIITTTSIDSNGSNGTGVDTYYVGYSSALTNNAVFSLAWDYPDISGNIYQFSDGQASQQFITVPPIADEGSHTVRTRTLSAGTGAIGAGITWFTRAQVINQGSSTARIGLGTGTNVEFQLRVVDSSAGINTTLSYTQPIAVAALCEAT